MDPGSWFLGTGWSNCPLFSSQTSYVLLLNCRPWYLGGTGMVGSILFAWIQGYDNISLHLTINLNVLSIVVL